MVKLSNVKLPVDYTEKLVLTEIAKMLKIPQKAILEFQFVKLSVDARKKHNVHYTATVDVTIDEKYIRETEVIKKNKKLGVALVKPYEYYTKKVNKPKLSPVVIGAGPAGLFCGLVLAQSGACPIVIERGKCVEERQKDVESFWNTGILNTNSNVQFGEGGAGTFSDGKLNTGTKDIRAKKVLMEFVKHGAPKEILYNAKPHIGTDRLPVAVKNIRNEIIRLGGKVLFETQLTDIIINDNKVCKIVVNTKDGREIIECDNLVLALGHSARDTFEMINNLNIPMEQKPFSVGARIEHLQSEINKTQYGDFAGKGSLGAADYKLAVHLENGRGVYTFCMCPGGTVVAAASEENRLVTNGMSKFARAEVNANSALLVGVNPNDFGSEDVLAGVELQRKLEEKAFVLGEGSYKAPVQRVADFMHRRKTTTFGSVIPSYTAGVTMADIHNCLPEYITESLEQGIKQLDLRLNGFANGDAILTAVETRSSSPVRIIRGKNMESIGVQGLYPCGEGAGYAGGIMSAAVDGIKCAEMIITKYRD
ncbi:MAG: hypothetical protein U0M12_04645 [Acutalibacteraceae bacterium]|nr:hypothetical protein [Acutalibacteraceae bacterium]